MSKKGVLSMLEASTIQSRKSNRPIFPSSGIPIVSLFSGSGGLDLGFMEAGFEPIIAIDVEEAAVDTHRDNLLPDHQNRVIQWDLSDIPPGFILKKLKETGATKVPVGVIGGPPCQAFSLSNVHKKTNDPRARLPLSYATILKDLNDTFAIDFFLFENVMGLRHKQHEEVFLYFKELFEAAGFNIFEGELDAKHFGVPQERKRVFIVGLNRKRYPDLAFRFPTGRSEVRTVRQAIGDLPEPVFFTRGLAPDDIPVHPNHWCMTPRSLKFHNGALKEGDIKGRPFRVLSWSQPSWTVAYGHREVHVHPTGKRRLSVLEAMLLQGFPPWYQLHGTLSDQIRLVSDAVPPPLGRALAKQICKTLTNTESQNAETTPHKDRRPA